MLFRLAYFKHFKKCYHITCIFWQLALCSRCYAQGSVLLIQVTLVPFFLPCYVLIVFHWVPVLLFIYSPSNGHLGCFLVFTITNTVALNIVYLPPREMVASLERREEYSTREKELSHQWALEEGKLTFIDPLSAKHGAWQLKYMSSAWTWEIPSGRAAWKVLDLLTPNGSRHSPYFFQFTLLISHFALFRNFKGKDSGVRLPILVPSVHHLQVLWPLANYSNSLDLSSRICEME